MRVAPKVELSPEQAKVLEQRSRGRSIRQTVVDEALSPWRLRQRVPQVIVSAAATMPPEVQTPGDPWHSRAIDAAAGAVQAHANASSIAELESAANLAVRAVRRQYELAQTRLRIVDEVLRASVPSGQADNARTCPANGPSGELQT
jgi:hypothetical protein